MGIKPVKIKALNILFFIVIIGFTGVLSPKTSWSWYDETHIAVAKVAGLQKWYNAAGADMIKVKAAGVEKANHYVNNPPGTHVTPAKRRQVGSSGP